jgi:hypothetical protein
MIDLLDIVVVLGIGFVFVVGLLRAVFWMEKRYG